MLNGFYSSIEKEPRKDKKGCGKLSGNYISKYHRLLHNMLERAVQWQLLTINPAASVEPPKAEVKEYKIYDDKQSLLLLDALDNETTQWKALIMLALFTQMRRGELIALDWKNVDMDSNTLNVERSAIYIPGNGIQLKEPKTKSSLRRITLSKPAADILKELHREQTSTRLLLGQTWVDSGAVFTQWNGKRMHVDSPTKWFAKLLKRAGLPHIRFHDLRHTGASMLIASGMDIQTVKKRLGHARASTTMDIYGHAFDIYDRRPADVLDALLDRSKARK